MQEQGFDVLMRIVGINVLHTRIRTLACERLLEIADGPVQSADAALQMALNLLASGDGDRSGAQASRVDDLLDLARVALPGTHREPLLLATEANQLLRKGQFKAAQDQYRKALGVCSSWGCGRLRGEIARDLLALEVADAALPTEEHSAAGKYYRNMVAFGMFETVAPSLEDAALLAYDYFWKVLFKPYRDAPNIKAPQRVRSEELLSQLASAVMRDSAFNTQAWLDQNRKVLSRQRLRDVRGDSALTFLLKFMANLRDVAPLEIIERMRSFLLTLIAAWPEQINMKDFKAQTALMLAANDGEVSIVRRLLAGGADVDVQDYLGRTALHAAVTGDSPECVQLVLAEGPNIQNTTFVESQSALHTAVRIGNVSVVSALAQALPDLLTSTNVNGDTPEAEAQRVLDHYDQYCSMMARQTSRKPATRSAMMAIVALLQSLDLASVDGRLLSAHANV